MKKFMKQVISIIITVSALVCAVPVHALTSGSFDYELVDGKAVITSYNGSAKTVSVPAEIDGYAVYEIGESAFKDNSVITKVTVASGVEAIGASAFENCTKLATITLPSTIRFFGEKAIYNTAFYNNEKNWKEKVDKDSANGGSGEDTLLWEDIVADNLDYLYLGKILVHASYSGSYAIKYGTTVIADGAFAGCEATKVSLSSQTATIGNNAFKDCSKLTTVVLFTNLQFVGKSAFENCTSLDAFQFPEKDIEMYASAFYNTKYYNESNNWDGDILCYGTKVIGINPECLVAEIPEGMTEVIGEALLDKDAIIPETVTKISSAAFTNKDGVTIYGYSGTYAEEYATINHINFVDLNGLIKGDVNFDGEIDREDYNILSNICTTREVLTDIIARAGDMDDDGAVDGIDVIILDLMLNGMPPSRLKGDADGDGDVDWHDYELLVAISQIRARVTDNVMFIRCDLNEDGAVDSYDAICLDLALKNIIPLV